MKVLFPVELRVGDLIFFNNRIQIIETISNYGTSGHSLIVTTNYHRHDALVFDKLQAIKVPSNLDIALKLQELHVRIQHHEN